MRRPSLALALLAMLLPGPTFAEDYPNRAMTLVVPFTAGGIADAGGRVVAKALSSLLGQPVVVENKAGAGGIVGAEFVANAKPDGYTLLIASNGVAVTYPFLYKKLSFDPQKNFTAVHGISISPLMIAVRASASYKTLPELIAYAKKNPGKVNYATVGQGSAHHMLGELLQKEAGVTMTQIPYKGATPAFTDFLGGVIDVMIDYQLQLAPLVEAGKIRALGVAAAERLPTMPDVPTFVEQGYKSVLVSAYSILLAPSGTPQPIIDKLAATVGDLLKDPAIVKYYGDRGSRLMTDYKPSELTAFLDEERKKTKQMIEQSGLQPE
ncbi:tripartite tricarboxylate transporter substrate binding protein [Bradyrhizobium sp. LHD-71]|uniref:Bug family tripartite tricarboxylate transporter substrate binding protein n=1 Tax=Bradyrhizobium sp. LHD-71 TaxID=3072141 RepID=UPI00280DAC59|nr:tripartite tricarboxylate transporter substrate binding protein [Bradyrhizobium sp. LHD-71]MDQ8727167.1 tripartite tricarboxylate transporter substrate binding protein [Bradyrhizobium sp. LHD-71]